jgi:hypothetical protein
MIRARALLFLVVSSTLAVPALASSQESVPAWTSSASGTTSVARDDGGAAAARFAPSANSVVLLTPVRPELGLVGPSPDLFGALPQVRDQSGVPFMVAGGILFVAGAIVGGDGGTLLMVGGAGIGAFGAYKYFGGE